LSKSDIGWDTASDNSKPHLKSVEEIDGPDAGSKLVNIVDLRKNHDIQCLQSKPYSFEKKRKSSRNS